MNDSNSTLSELKTEIAAIKALLLEQTQKPLTFKQAAEYADLSTSHLYKLTSAGKIKHYKPEGKKLYFAKADLDAFLLRNPIQTNAELEQKATNYVTLGKRGN